MEMIMVLLNGFLKGIEWKELDRTPITGGKGQIILFPKVGQHSAELVKEVVKELKALNRPILVDWSSGVLDIGL
jgi:hypothetical protein